MGRDNFYFQAVILGDKSEIHPFHKKKRQVLSDMSSPSATSLAPSFQEEHHEVHTPLAQSPKSQAGQWGDSGDEDSGEDSPRPLLGLPNQLYHITFRSSPGSLAATEVKQAPQTEQETRCAAKLQEAEARRARVETHRAKRQKELEARQAEISKRAATRDERIEAMEHRLLTRVKNIELLKATTQLNVHSTKRDMEKSNRWFVNTLRMVNTGLLAALVFVGFKLVTKRP